MKPESSFKNLREMLVSLPIDYYILLQDGFDRPKRTFDTTNYVYVRNLPILSKKKTFFKTKKKELIKTIYREDLLRCVDRREAESLLMDPFAEETLVEHLQSRYGTIEE
jgi:hypothetical protein